MEETKPIAEAVEEITGEKLGVEWWDRREVFRESAAAATDDGLPYWLVLVLSGAIATLGLALNSSAVVIGAMLVAPLLAPVMGLALSLAVGDGRLAVQTGAVVLASTIAVIVIGAVLTSFLPFHTITLEISARTRPTTLDLAIAVFSGLVGAVVTVARRSRLSAAIPGVAISVALIPPLAVAGFGIGVGWNGDLIRGSLLLYGANLAGIVLSGMVVFLLVGMYNSDVWEAARQWHKQAKPHGIAAWTDRLGWVRSLGVLRSPWARVGLVVGFAVALGVPLSRTLEAIVRETRVDRAVGETAERIFEVPGQASILSRQLVLGADRSQVYLRVATTDWFGAEAREEFERLASARAGEPVRLSLEQLPTTGGDLEQLAALLPGGSSQPVRPPPPPPPVRLPELLSNARDQLQQVISTLSLPSGAKIAGVELTTTRTGETTLNLAYVSPAVFVPQVEEILAAQLRTALQLPELGLRLTHVSAAPRPLEGAATGGEVLRETADLLEEHPELAAELVGQEADSVRLRSAVDWLVEQGIDQERVVTRYEPTAIAPRVAVRARTRAGSAQEE